MDKLTYTPQRRSFIKAIIALLVTPFAFLGAKKVYQTDFTVDWWAQEFDKKGWDHFAQIHSKGKVGFYINGKPSEPFISPMKDKKFHGWVNEYRAREKTMALRSGSTTRIG